MMKSWKLGFHMKYIGGVWNAVKILAGEMKMQSHVYLSKF